MTTARLLASLLACSTVAWTGLAASVLLWRADLAVWSMLVTCAVALFVVLAWGWNLTRRTEPA
jgi:hypothetical protein